MCLLVAQIFIRDFHFDTRNFLDYICTYHSATSVGLSVFLQEISVIVRTYNLATSVGLSIFIQEIFVITHTYHSATSVGLYDFVQEIFVNGMYVPSNR